MKEVIMKVPSFSADYPKAPIYVADLVRCKECKYASDSEYTQCSYVTWYNGEDDFCSRGEREGE